MHVRVSCRGLRIPNSTERNSEITHSCCRCCCRRRLLLIITSFVSAASRRPHPVLDLVGSSEMPPSKQVDGHSI